MSDRSKHSKMRERGQTTAEFVMVIPALLLFFFLMVDFGWLLKNWIVVTNTAREVARCAIASSCSLDGADADPDELGVARMNQGLLLNWDNPPVVTLQYVDQDGDGDASPGDSLVVCVQGENKYIAPTMAFLAMVTGGALPDPLPLRAREEMIIEFPPQYDVDEGDGTCDF